MSEFYTTVDDDLYNELCELEGQKIMHVAVWDDSFEQAVEEGEEGEETSVAPAAKNFDPAQNTFDLDLYLENGVYFELYSVALFPSLEGEPLHGFETVETTIQKMLKAGMRLQEVAVDESDLLVLVCKQGRDSLFLQVAGWDLQEWDELPS